MIMPSAWTREPCASTIEATRPEVISEKYSAGPNLQRDFGQRRSEQGYENGGDGASKKG